MIDDLILAKGLKKIKHLLYWSSSLQQFGIYYHTTIIINSSRQNAKLIVVIAKYSLISNKSELNEDLLLL